MGTQAYNGTYSTNPFNFKHHNLTQVGVYVDGEQIPRKPLFLNFDETRGQNVTAAIKACSQALESYPKMRVIKSVEAIMALVTQHSALTCPQTTAQVTILS